MSLATREPLRSQWAFDPAVIMPALATVEEAAALDHPSVSSRPGAPAPEPMLVDRGVAKQLEWISTRVESDPQPPSLSERRAILRRYGPTFAADLFALEELTIALLARRGKLPWLVPAQLACGDRTIASASEHPACRATFAAWLTSTCQMPVPGAHDSSPTDRAELIRYATRHGIPAILSTDATFDTSAEESRHHIEVWRPRDALIAYRACWAFEDLERWWPSRTTPAGSVPPTAPEPTAWR